MLITSDMSTPILSRSSGCPLTSKVAIVTMHCHMFFGCFVFCFSFYVTLLNSFTYLLSYRFIFIHVSTVMPVLSVTGWPLPHRKTQGCSLWKDMLTGPG